MLFGWVIYRRRGKNQQRKKKDRQLRQAYRAGQSEGLICGQKQTPETPSPQFWEASEDSFFCLAPSSHS